MNDLSAASGLPGPELASALWDLVGRGLVTGDGFQPLRDLMTSARATRHRGRAVHGRWALVERLPEASIAVDDLAGQIADQLLVRYGVVFRELAARESFTVPWREIARALRKREARGLVRGGRFVSGLMGEQYALPDAVDALRRVRRQARSGDEVRICATDPLNLVGILTPGPRIPAHPGAGLSFVDGAFVEAQDPRPGRSPARAPRLVALPREIQQ
jgi:ATP-dependent Lhr-like helicase